MHLVMPLGFGDELDSVSQDMRAVVYELAYGFAVLFGLMAYLSLRHSEELLTTDDESTEAGTNRPAAA